MVRVKRGKISIRRRRKVLRRTRGFRGQARRKERAAIERILHAGVHSFHDRRKKKGNMRRLWNININAALRQSHNLSYSKFIDALKKSGIKLDRKVLAELAHKHPAIFAKVVEEATKS